MNTTWNGIGSAVKSDLGGLSASKNPCLVSITQVNLSGIA